MAKFGLSFPKAPIFLLGSHPHIRKVLAKARGGVQLCISLLGCVSMVSRDRPMSKELSHGKIDLQ